MPFPAARVTDMHVCALFTGPVPRVGGPVLPPGCSTVLIGKLPAARATDMCLCVGPPDTIVMGYPTIMVGKMPPAYLGSLTPMAERSSWAVPPFSMAVRRVAAVGVVADHRPRPLPTR